MQINRVATRYLAIAKGIQFYHSEENLQIPYFLLHSNPETTNCNLLIQPSPNSTGLDQTARPLLVRLIKSV